MSYPPGVAELAKAALDAELALAAARKHLNATRDTFDEARSAEAAANKAHLAAAMALSQFIQRL